MTTREPLLALKAYSFDPGFIDGIHGLPNELMALLARFDAVVGG